MQVRIISTTEAKEVNPLGEEEPIVGILKYGSYEHFLNILDRKDWIKSEAACKTYKIDLFQTKCGGATVTYTQRVMKQINVFPRIGSIHEAELLESGMIKIID